jgi:DNA-binding GntR family transcriptional regulator
LSKALREVVRLSEDGLIDETFEWEHRTQLVHDVAKALRERIYSGTYPPGHALRQVQLSSQFRVSRTPLREALRLLEQEGLVTATRGGGVRVISIDLKQMLDAYAMREVIDGLAASEAARNADKSSIAQLLRIIDSQRHAMNPWTQSAYVSANVQFHAAILELSGNSFLVREQPIIRMTSQVFKPTSHLGSDRALQAIEEHGEIVDAIRSGNPAIAEQVARRHVRNTMESLRGNTTM